MRLLFVVQRYGQEVAGGAELHCRLFAERLARRGHHVEVLTTCAKSYVDWANHYAAGTEELAGVTVHRLPVQRPRNNEMFGEINSRVVWSHKYVPLYLQKEWMRLQGPVVPELTPWLAARAHLYDVVIFFTYLYYTTWAGLAAASGRVPTILHPTAHDEPPLHLPIFALTMKKPTALALSTEEEQALLERVFGINQSRKIIGIGTDLDVSGEETTFRNRFGIGDSHYILFVGRVDPGKGSLELFDYFNKFKERNPGDLKLVIVGDSVSELSSHPDVIVTGFVDDKTRVNAMEGALLLVQPSYFESFSMVLTEAWAQRLPALVQGRCAVLEGQARRSGGAIPYRGFAEFETGLLMLLENPSLRTVLGEAGRRYVELNYEWDEVMNRYEGLITSVKA